MRPPDDQQLAEVLDRGAAQRRADGAEHLFARGPVVAEDADLDELVRRERQVDLVQHRRREPVVTDADDGVQVVGFRAQRAALGG
jgi:hypothetical protein